MPSKNNGSGGARRVKTSKSKARADAAPAPRDVQERTRNEKGHWLPGQSGNPEGRPPGISLVTLLKEELEKAGVKEDLVAREVVQKLISLAQAGDFRAISDIIDRTDGKPTQRSEITGADGGPVINVIHQDYEPEETNGDGNRAAIINRLKS